MSRGIRPSDTVLPAKTGAEILARRRREGRTQAQLALYLGISTETVHKLEHGGRVRSEVFERVRPWLEAPAKQN